MKQKLSFLILTIFFFVNGYSQTVATQPPNLIQCGNEVFDLTQQTSIILGAQDPQFFTVTYFRNWDDAFNLTNAITMTSNYVAVSGESIYARVINTQDNTYAIINFLLLINEWQDVPANSPGQVTVCDDGSGFVTIDLTTYITQITGGDDSLIVTFHPNEGDVWPGLNPVVNPSSFLMPVNQYSIFFRVENESSCVNIGEIFFVSVPCTDNTVSGTLTFDAENNTCASGTTPGAYIMMALTHNNDVYYTYTDANGNYTFTNVPDGDNYIYVAGQGPFTFSASPASYTVTAPGELTGNNFCLGEADPLNDAVIIVTPLQNPRPGFPVTYNVMVYNAGNTTLSGDVTVQFDDTKLVYVSSSPTMTLSGNTLTIPYSNLAPFSHQLFVVDFTVMTPPTVNQGTPITVTGSVTPLVDDAFPINNVYTCTRLATNSMDPNDITCREGLYITEEQADEYLHYVIRFQNTGNDEAVFIRVEDILDEKLDPATFQPIGASHDYRVEILNNEVKFIFDDINLPGEDNEPESHGFVAYRIKPRANVQLGDTFEATASIFFDFNEAIVTNTAETTIQNVAGIEKAFANAFVVYPNPASHIVNIQANDIAATAVDMKIVNVLGKTVMSNTLQMQGQTTSFDVSSLDKGVYFLTLESEGKSVTKKLVVK
jgi:hypothetical protein